MPKIVYTANWDWVLYNFRRSLAGSLRREGYEVTLVCPDGEYVEALRDGEGFRWVEWSLSRRSLNPIREMGAVRTLARIYRREDPDIVHHDTIKPNVYGSLACALNRAWPGEDSTPMILNSFMGIGFMFSERSKARLLRPLVLPVMRLALRQRRAYTTFSNQSDRERFLELGLTGRDTSGLMISEFVDTNRFRPTAGSRPEAAGDPDELVVVMAARLLWDKGVGEFVGAAERLAERGVAVRMCLAGTPDTESPGFVPESRLRGWDRAGVVDWLGHRSDMPALLRSADIAVLPTHYNEGLPRFLVESAASGLPLIASDMPACRRVVEHGENGFLIPTRDSGALADAIETLASDPALRRTMGEVSRARALDEFDEGKVTRAWIHLYESLLEARSARSPGAS